MRKQNQQMSLTECLPLFYTFQLSYDINDIFSYFI